MLSIKAVVKTIARISLLFGADHLPASAFIFILSAVGDTFTSFIARQQLQ